MKDKNKKKRKKNIALGERDDEGKLLTPHTFYGVMKNLKFLFQKIVKYKRSLLLIFVVGIFTQSIMRYLWSYIGKFLVDMIQAGTGADGNLHPLLKLLLCVAIVEIVCIGGNVIVQNRIGFQFNYVRLKLVTEKNDKLLSMRYQTLEQPHILDLHQRAGNALDGDWQGVGGMMNRSFATGALIITMLVSASTIIVLDTRLILVLIVAMMINYGSQQWSIRDDKKHFWDKVAPIRRKMNYMERCTQDFDYAKDIRVFSMKNWLLDKLQIIQNDYTKKYKRSRQIWFRHSFIYCSSGVLSSSVMYYILVTQVLKENISIGDFTLYLGLCSAFSSALSDFYDNFGRIHEASNLVDDYRTFMDFPVEEQKEYMDISTLGSNYSFEFRNVTFRYEGASEDTLKDINLSIPAGQRIAVVGKNGAGKTTLIKLLMGLYEVTSGEILVNGININHFKREDYYKLFSPVFQNVELFAFPLAENVSMKKPEQTDKKMAEECLINAGMGEKLRKLEKGCDTEVLKILYEDGIDFSGGERQKLALARALYKDAPVVILDEPTAALDPIAESALYESFDQVISKKSAVYISHRLSSTRFCDKIVMIMEGTIKEYGTHEELMNKGGEYAKMFEVQAQYYEVNDDEE